MRFVQDVRYLNRLLCHQRATERSTWRRSNYWIPSPLLDIWLWRTMHCNSPKGISFASIQNAELGLADASRILQHRLEHRLQLARRTANDAQHLRRRSLLLQ